MNIHFYHEKIGWDFRPEDIENFLGGTESWLVELSSALVRRGHSVSVFGDFRANSIYRNVRYYRRDDGARNDVRQAQVFWNHPSGADGVDLGQAKNFYWSNGIDRWASDYGDFYKSLAAFVPMGAQQAEETLAPLKGKAYVIPGGVDPLEYPDLGKIKKNVGQCIFSSSWDRGLDVILAAWPYIKRKSPNLSLVITYGGHGKWQDPGKMPVIPDLPDVKCLPALTRASKSCITQESSWLLFANREPRKMERGIYLSAIEAQYVGCLPITTPHVVADGDIYGGVQVACRDWANTVIALTTNPELEAMARSRMAEKKVPTWDEVAKQWEALIVSKL